MARRKSQPTENSPEAAEEATFNVADFDKPDPQGLVEKVADGIGMPPEMQEQSEKRAEKEERRSSFRGWTTRHQPPELAYQRFDAIDQTGEMQIMFKFKLPKGQDKPSEGVLEILRSHKKTLEGYDTGLHFENDAKYGPVWKMPKSRMTAGIADSLDHCLDKLAQKVESQGATR